jgi:hypothetical protein
MLSKIDQYLKNNRHTVASGIFLAICLSAFLIFVDSKSTVLMQHLSESVIGVMVGFIFAFITVPVRGNYWDTTMSVSISWSPDVWRYRKKIRNKGSNNLYGFWRWHIFCSSGTTHCVNSSVGLFITAFIFFFVSFVSSW